jgi:protein-tyrosine phosphatase
MNPGMDLTRINPQGTLLVSGEIEDWTAVRRHGVTTVVDMDGDIDPGVPEAPNELLYVYFPIYDENLPDLRKLDAVARMVASLVQASHVVLVHCRMGFNRSTLVAATALTYLGMSGREACEHLQMVRPGALYNEAFAEHVRSLPARRLRLEELSEGGR